MAIDDRLGIYTSADGSDWIHRVLQPETWPPYHGLASNQDGFVVTNGLAVFRSADGISWESDPWTQTPPSLNGQGRDVDQIVFDGGRYLAVAGGLFLMSSTNGRDWTPVPGQPWIQYLAHDGELTVAASVQGLERVSRDGISWQPLRSELPATASAFAIFRGRVFAFYQEGSGVVSHPVDQPIVVLETPVGGSVVGRLPFTLSVTIVPDPEVSFQWYRGPSGYTGNPIIGATTASVGVVADQDASYWVRLTRGDFAWDSPAAIVNPAETGFYVVVDGGTATALAVFDDGHAALVGFRESDDLIQFLPSGSIDILGKAILRGSAYIAGEDGIRFLENEIRGEVRDGVFVITERAVYPVNSTPRDRLKSSQGSYAEAGYYRFGLVGKPYSEGAVIVARDGAYVAVLHKSDAILSGAGTVPPGQSIRLGDPDRNLELLYDPANATVRGRFETLSESIPVAGLIRGSEHRSGLANLSSRGHAGTGPGVLIAGVSLGGSEATSLLIRGGGPALADFNVTNTLDDPELTVMGNGGLLAKNGNWGEFADPPALVEAFRKVGAFGFAPDSRDAALILRTEPQVFTVSIVGSE